MGQQNSKDESVYQQVIEGNVEAIKALCSEGARLEWIDKEGKTPLIVASMDPRLFLVAKTLIEMGANVNAYRPGRHAGTPLHHAAKRALDHTVKLLLSHGANPFVINDDCQTPLDVARAKGFGNVVRAIEAHICYFSGEIREMMVVPGILEPLVPQRLSRKRSKKSWVVVVPCSLPSSRKPPKLELAVYSSPQDPRPRTVIALWKCNIAEPKFHESDPALIIFDESVGTRHKFSSAIEGDRQKLTQLYSACQGLPKVVPSPPLHNSGTSPSSVEANAEAVELAMALNASIQSAANNQPLQLPSNTDSQSASAATATNGWADVADTTTHGGWGPPSRPPPGKASCSGSWAGDPSRDEYNGWAVPGPSPTPAHVPTPLPSAPPSAPPIPGDGLDDGPIRYPAVDVGPIDVLTQAAVGEEGKNDDDNSCVICMEAPIEGACIPCGHMAGCMSCLTQIKSRKGKCPVCRAKINQVIRLYAV